MILLLGFFYLNDITNAVRTMTRLTNCIVTLLSYSIHEFPQVTTATIDSKTAEVGCVLCGVKALGDVILPLFGTLSYKRCATNKLIIDLEDNKSMLIERH